MRPRASWVGRISSSATRCVARTNHQSVRSNAWLALAWVLAKPFVTAPIVGATKLQHLEDAHAALSVQLTPAETALLEGAYVPHAVVGFS